MECLNHSLVDLQPLMNQIFNSMRNTTLVSVTDETIEVPKSSKYYTASANLQQRILTHQHAILKDISSRFIKDEFQEALSLFATAKQSNIMKEVSLDLKRRGDK